MEGNYEIKAFSTNEISEARDKAIEILSGFEEYLQSLVDEGKLKDREDRDEGEAYLFGEEYFTWEDSITEIIERKEGTKGGKQMKRYLLSWERKQFATSYVYANSEEEAIRKAENGKQESFEECTDEFTGGNDPLEGWRVYEVEEV